MVETGSNNSGKAGEKKEGRIKKFLNWLTEVFWDAETVEEKGEIKEQKHTKAKKAEEKAKRKAEKKAKRRMQKKKRETPDGDLLLFWYRMSRS